MILEMKIGRIKEKQKVRLKDTAEGWGKAEEKQNCPQSWMLYPSLGLPLFSCVRAGNENYCQQVAVVLFGPSLSQWLWSARNQDSQALPRPAESDPRSNKISW